MKRIALIMSAVFLWPFAANADLSYNYVGAQYVNIDIDDFDEDADGFGVNASGQLSKDFFVFASYTDVETDRFPFSGASVKAEEQTITAGLGYRLPLQSGTDLNATVAFVDDEIDVSASSGGLSGSASEDDTGFGVGLAVRHLFTPQFEGGAGISYVDIYDDNSLFAFGPLARDVGSVAGNRLFFRQRSGRLDHRWPFKLLEPIFG